MYNIFKDLGYEIFHSNNGGEFISHEITNMIKDKLKAEFVHGRPRHPQSQGQVERVNQTFKTKIKPILVKKKR